MKPITQHQEDAANALFQAERTQQAHAIQTAETAWQRFLSGQSRAAAATQREAQRLHAIGAAGRYDESIAGHYGATF